MSLLESTCKAIYPQDNEYRELATKRLDQLAIPHWALGDVIETLI